MLLMKVAVVPWVEYSPRKIEIGREKTTEMTSARKEVARVPTTNGNAPNSLLTGSHVEVKRNRIPKSRMAGKEAITNEKKMASKRSSINTPAMDSILRKKDSESAGLCQRIVSVLTPSARTSALLRFIFHVPFILSSSEWFRVENETR
jgi:hypothetical protein